MQGNIDEIERATYGIAEAKEILTLATGAFLNGTPMSFSQARSLSCVLEVVERILNETDNRVSAAISAYYAAVK